MATQAQRKAAIEDASRLVNSGNLFVTRLGTKPHWYKITVTECPLCGKGEEIRERMYTPKPSNPNKRFTHETVYDWCDI